MVAAVGTPAADATDGTGRDGPGSITTDNSDTAADSPAHPHAFTRRLARMR
ncbi:hypothetical protein ACVV2G_19710 [Streptomyces ziwulingensis]